MCLYGFASLRNSVRTQSLTLRKAENVVRNFALNINNYKIRTSKVRTEKEKERSGANG